MRPYFSLKNSPIRAGILIVFLLAFIGGFNIAAHTPLQAETIQKNNSENRPKNKESSSLEDKVTLYLQLLTGKDNTAQSYIDFLKENPDWPNRGFFMIQMQKALLSETNRKNIQNICKEQTLTLSSSLAFCAEQTSITPKLVQEARTVWINSVSLPDHEKEILSHFSTYFTPQDQWNRFDRLESTGLSHAATRQLGYLTAQQQILAKARLAFRKNQPDAENQFKSLLQKDQEDTGLVYDYLHWLRIQSRNEDAVQLWIKTGLKSEQNAKSGKFWTERKRLIYALLKDNNPQSAYALVKSRNCQQATCQYEEAFLAGWINLRYLNNPLDSVGYFQKLILSGNTRNKSRGYYWLGQAYQALGNVKEAKKNWQQAGAFPTEFYGQMAIAKLHGSYKQNILLHPELLIADIQPRLAELPKDPYNKDKLKSFKNSELIKALQILVQQGDNAHAYPFLLAFIKQHPALEDQATLARLAAQLHFPAASVMMSHLANNRGIIFLQDGWPRPYTLTIQTNTQNDKNSLPAGLLLAIMRQESGFNPLIVSYSHAYGLMQLLPSTARDMTRKAGIPIKMGNPGNLVVPANNIRLGTAYLDKLMQKFNRNLLYVIASYNAGPNRVNQWIQENNVDLDTNTLIDETIDWIELLPYSETRNYVQRVLANMIVYQTNINQ